MSGPIVAIALVLCAVFVPLAFVPGPAQEPVAQFWRGFHDPELDQLIDAALNANADLRIAAANLREVRALARYADAQGASDIGVAATAARARA